MLWSCRKDRQIFKVPVTYYYMTKEEIEELKKQKSELNKEIEKKKNEMYIKKWKEWGLFQKIGFVIGVIVLIFLLGCLGIWIRNMIGF